MKLLSDLKVYCLCIQELMANFRTIIVPEAIKNIYTEDPTVMTVVQNVQTIISGQKMSLKEIAESIEARFLEGVTAEEVSRVFSNPFTPDSAKSKINKFTKITNWHHIEVLHFK